MKKLRCLSLVLIFALVLPSASVMARAPDETDGAASAPEISETGWYIVEFEAPSLAVHARSRAADVGVMSVGGKLNVNAAASQSYVNQLKGQQAAFRASLAKAIPGARVGRGFQIALNAVAVELPDGESETLRELRAMPGVKRVSPDRIYTVAMDASLPLINASALWDLLGGRENAGAGIKVADIDSGIDPDHPLFDGTGWSYPTTDTWPKGDASFCNGKIIAARYYTPTFTVNVSETMTPQDHAGHGTHTAGTAVGNPVTATYAYGAIETNISGVAPGAWLMVYKALFRPERGTGTRLSSIMGLEAVEDAIADGADVINNSWGWWLEYVYDFPLTAAYEAAVDAGIVVVFCGGNDGPEYNTLWNPTSPKFIKVGASTTKRNYYNEVSVTAPEPVSPTLQSFRGKEFVDLDPSAIPTTTIGPLPYIPCNLEGHPDTTLPGVTPDIAQTEPYSSTGWIALIPRGEYDFWVKLDGAIEEGASAVAIYTDDRDWRGSWLGFDRPIYTVMTARDVGLDALDWWETYTDTARLQIGYPPMAMEIDTEDVIADFSSRGPNLRLEINPDVVAPGVRILSGVADGTYDLYQGTSMATPHVTGAAALLKQLHPTWTPAQIKSALMSTASQTVLDTDETTVADVMTQGAGRIDLSKAGDPGLTFDKPSHSLGMVATGSTVSTGINATDVSGATESYAVSVQETVADTGYVTVTVTPATLNVAANGTASFTVTVEVGAGATAQDIEGNVILSGTTHMAHIPYWARIHPPSPNDILLIDDDLSGTTWDFADYQSYYTSTLDALGLTYDIWDTTEFGNGAPQFPTRDVLDRYDTVVYFSGDGQTYFWWWWQDRWEHELRSFLAGGGDKLAFGQDAAWGMDWWAWFDTGSYFGVWYDEHDAFGGEIIPQPSAVGVAPFLEGKEIDFSSGGDGAGNMTSVDSLIVTDYWSDMSNIPLFKVTETFTPTQGTGYLGAGCSSDPTLERVADPIRSGWFRSAWRSTFCSFGLEAINDTTGYHTRTALLSDLFDYVNDDVSVAFAAGSYGTLDVPGTVHFTATIASSVGADAVRYRWDFGDGSAYETTIANNVTHEYTMTGTYNARVEVTDVYSHTAVSYPVQVIVGMSKVYLPLVLRSFP